MKKILIIFILLLLFLPINVFGTMYDLPDVTIEKLPTTVIEFLDLRDRIATTPQGGYAIIVIALIMYVENPEIGEQCLVIAVDKNTLIKGKTYEGYSINRTRMRLIESQIGKHSGKSYIPYSYIQGTSPQNGYKLPESNLKMTFFYNQYSGDIDENGNYSGDQLKVFTPCSGADSPRPVTLVKNNKGIWKAAEFSSIIVGIRPPETDDPADDL